MNCFPCFDSKKSDTEEECEEGQLPVAQPKEPLLPSHSYENKQTVDTSKIAAKAYTLREMAIATKNFRQECLMFDDGFGKVVAIKQLDRNGMKGGKEFLEEVAALSPLKHPNLINLLGYCADGDQRILVYEHMPFGSLEAHLLARPADESPLDWATRMKIATGAAQGLQYLHDEANPPVIYRDFKSSNILLDEEFNPRLCDYGLAKVAESGSTSSLPPRVMGTYGYSAPEYASSGELTLKSDVYSFGVVLLELISGRRAIDPDRPPNEQNLITLAQPIFRDPRRFFEMADPLLMLDFSVKSLNQAIGIAAMCLQEEPTVRPFIGDVVTALSFLDFTANDPPASLPPSGKESTKDADDDDQSNIEKERSSSNQNAENDDDESSISSDDEENVKNDNEDDECSSPLDHEPNNNKELCADRSSEDEKIRENRDDHEASFSSDNVNMNEVHDDMSGYSMDDDDTALVIELDYKNGSSGIFLDQEYDDDDDDDDDEIDPITRTESSNSKKGKVVEISDDESIYSPRSSGSSSSSSIDYKLGEKKTTQKAKSTKKTSVGNSSRKKSDRWRREELVLDHETGN
ncbi:hypothetical protein DCAR_0831157 [Daucus carota subsp. sativus]|uniref:Protein kinase domain-containing protein n=1 Tax=Daucus carota subsp. sativus TaxID=79200 RepID=A0AAF0XR30_DAUCS|nr:hypothetical protein DCAR_0831157 [Daucus carota subsp. sativus]